MKSNGNPSAGRVKRRLLRILFWIIGISVVLISVLFSVGYFYYGRIIESYLIESIHRESKGIYTATIGRIYLGLLTGNISITDFTLHPDTALYDSVARTDTVSPLLLELTLKKLKVRELSVMNFIRNRQLIIRSIRFESPDIHLFLMRADSIKSRNVQGKEKMISIPLPKGIEMIRIDGIKVDEGKFAFTDATCDSMKTFLIPYGEINIRDILVDKVTQEPEPIFDAADIRILLKKLKFMTKNKLYDINIGSIAISTHDSAVTITGLSLEPKFDRKEFSNRVGFQTDRMEIKIDTIQSEKFDIKNLILTGGLIAGRSEIKGITIEDYRDKRIAPQPGHHPLMPHDLVRNTKRYFRFDTLIIRRGKITYSEQIGYEPGSIFMDNMDASITGLTNDSAMLNAGLISVLEGTAYLQGKGKLQATFKLPLGDLNNQFSYSASMGAMDICEVNPMVTRLIPLKVNSGKINRLIITGVVADKYMARGNMFFYYNDLEIELMDQSDNGWSKLTTGILNFAANNLILYDRNPSKSGRMNTGVILYRRDPAKGIFNYLWKSTLSGLKSAVGLDSKEQKAVKKERTRKQNKK